MVILKDFWENNKFLTVLMILAILITSLYFQVYRVPNIDGVGAWGNSQGNIANGGLFAMDGDWLYYRNNGDGGKLYKLNLNTWENIQLTDENVQYINVIGEWIYYQQFQPTEFRIVRKDGKRDRSLYKSNVSQAFIQDNIYFFNRERMVGGIYAMDLSGRGRKHLRGTENTINHFTVDDTFMYFIASGASNLTSDIEILPGNRIQVGSSDYYLLKTPLNGDEGNIVLLDEQFDRNTILIAEGEWLYYLGPSYREQNLYRMNINTGETFKLIDERIKTFNISGQYLFYTTIEEITENGEVGRVYRSNLDGSDEILLLDQYLPQIHVLDGWIYYDHEDDITGEYSIRRLSIDGLQNEVILIDTKS